MNHYIRGALAALMLTLPNLAYAGGYCYPKSYSYPVRTNYVYTAPKVYQVTKYEPIATTTYNYTINNNQPAAAAGNTPYGITQFDALNATPDLKLQLSANIYERSITANHAQWQTAVAAHTQDVAAIASVQLSSTKVAALQAYNVGAAAAVQSVENQNGVNVTVQQQPAQVQQQGAGVPPPPVAAQGAAAQGAEQIILGIDQKCAVCHSQATAPTKGKNVVMPPLLDLTQEELRIVLRRTFTHDHQARMPQNGTLTDEEIGALVDRFCLQK